MSFINCIFDILESSGSKVDFYRKAWVSETRQCVPLLHKVRENVNELLDQWPDFPTLKDVSTPLFEFRYHTVIMIHDSFRRR